MVRDGLGGVAVSKKVAPVEPAVDEHQGVGGSYVINPATGKRELVERTKTIEEAEAEAKEKSNGTA